MIYFALFSGALGGWMICAILTAGRISDLESEIDELRSKYR